MSGDEERVERLLRRLDAAWAAFEASYAGLSGAQLVEPGVEGDWSVRDLLAHVTIWEEEALEHLPTIIAGGRPPRYATQGGIDAFNARMVERRRGLSLAEVGRRQAETHARLVAFIRSAPADQFARDTRARRRLRLDTYGHYPLHAAAIRAWREGRPAG
ncbi:MAG TPA: DinB family protein [Thermomicrobiales bacterium]|nr:DinB family protein [Thermomicrobiales bacterium]